jgi:UPF0042 nucleotide-binding protein
MKSQPNATLPDIIFLTGMSGAGRSSCLKIFENLGYNVIDNLPCFMLPQLNEGLKTGKITLPLVVGFDVRSFQNENDSLEIILQDFRKKQTVRLLFLECHTEILLKRYNASRQVHPLGGRTLLEAIERERQGLSSLKEKADHIIDTSVISVVTLGRVLRNIFSHSTSPNLQVRLMSFSYRRGLPPEADMVLDARFLENPHYEEHLKKKTGKDPEVVKFIVRDKSWKPVLNSIEQMLMPILEGFKNSGRSYLTIAIGCTGGQHRSVFMVEQLGLYLESLDENVFIEHRESAQWP